MRAYYICNTVVEDLKADNVSPFFYLSDFNRNIL